MDLSSSDAGDVATVAPAVAEEEDVDDYLDDEEEEEEEEEYDDNLPEDEEEELDVVSALSEPLGTGDDWDTDDSGWREEEDERDAGISIVGDKDDEHDEVDTSDAYNYLGSDESEDEELRRLLGELETQFLGKGDAASRSILASVEECGKVLEAEHTPVALDARAALAFAATARGDAPVDELDAEPAVDHELLEAFQALDADNLDSHLDEMCGWMVGNSSEAKHAGSSSAKTQFGRTVGLDLGTTNSAAAVVDADGAPKLLPPGLTPSVVCYIDGDLETQSGVDRAGRIALRDDDGRGIIALVGKDAEAMRDGVHAASVCSRVKRILARDATPAERRRVGAAESEKLTHTTTLRIPALPNRVAAAEVSAEVVRKLRDDALAFLGIDKPGAATRCVVGVPARFDEAAVEATKTACLLAGFKSAETILEPVAAALAYSATKDIGKETVLVFDLGGGTFDCCIVELNGKRAELLALGGDAKLGGDDFDAALAEHLADRFYDAHGLDVKAATARLRLLAEAERCKIALSRSNETAAYARGLARGSYGRRARGGPPLDLACDVTRPVVDALCRPLLAQLETAMRATCAEGGVALPGGSGFRHLDGVLLVGGATRMPAVGRMLRAATGLPLAKIASHGSVHPDEAVALGAAVRAAALDASSAGVAAPEASVVDKRHV